MLKLILLAILLLILGYLTGYNYVPSIIMPISYVGLIFVLLLTLA